MTKSKIPPQAGKPLILVILLLAVLQTVWFGVSVPVFAQSVDTAWVRRYDGPGNWNDYAEAIAVDSSSNVYVTGSSFASGTDYDYTTIKYYPNGDTAWVRRYNAPADNYDFAGAIAVDSSGNVYVTGGSIGTGTDYDYATIKYSPNGETAWVRRYDGPVNYGDRANAIAVDGSGNVCVTGASYGGSETSNDYATIKYYLNGDTAWVRRYNGLGSGDDEATAIAVDSSGNIYVTGSSFASGTDYDYATIKYYPNGDTAWVRRYNGPGNYHDKALAMAVDGSGHVYVTGSSYDGAADYATIKYYPNGDIAWVRRYNGPVNTDDEAGAIAVDGSGNVYVTGWSYGSGTWVDYATIKYYLNGDTAWVRRYNGPDNSHDEARAIAGDGSGNLYVSGGSSGSGTSWDYATVKYRPNGDTAWVRRYDGPGNSNDAACAIAVDGFGNVYVTGSSDGIETGYDYVTIKYVQFLCGDVNKDGIVELGDLVYLISYLFKSGPAPVPILHAGDANCDELVDLGDIVYLITYLYKSGPAPCC